MIEIVYNKEKEAATGNEEYFCIPKNIRQIGQVPMSNRIYMEDYVCDYLNTRRKESEKKGNAAILLGKCNWKEGVSYLFVKSVLFMEELEVSAEHISMTDAVWGNVYEEMKEFFPGQEVVGWYLSLPGNALKITDMIYRTHLNHFGGNDKVLFLADLDEQEEAFFLYRNGYLERQDGYYIYYEKNEPMQEYMLDKNPKESVDGSGKAQDRAVKDFRKIIARKNEEKESGKGNQFLYVAGTGVAVLSLALGVLFVSRKMQLDLPVDPQTMASWAVEEDTSKADVTASVSPEKETVSQIDKENGSEASSEDTPLGDSGQTGNALESGQESAQNTTGTDSDQTQETAGSQIHEEQLVSLDDLDLDTDTDLNADAGISESPESSQSVQTGSSAASQYTIRKGDTLTAISVRYYGDVQTVTEICKLNGLKEDDIIYPGQTILLP